MSKKAKKNVVIGILGTILDRSKNWQPSVQAVSQKDFPVARFYLLHDLKESHPQLAEEVKQKMEEASPQTEVVLYSYNVDNPWDFGQMSDVLYRFCAEYARYHSTEDYYVHVTTGTEIAKMCWCLFIVTGYLQAEMLQTIPPQNKPEDKPYTAFTPDLKYCEEVQKAIRKENAVSNRYSVKTLTNEDIKRRCLAVARTTKDPILLMGETGTGKTYLAKQIGKKLGISEEKFVECNCATLDPTLAGSHLFGHEKGAFTGADQKTDGILRRADEGILFLDEIGTLPKETQAMLLKAIEERKFYRVGNTVAKETANDSNGNKERGDKERVESDFFLICATNEDLFDAVKKGDFRRDLFARIDKHRFELAKFVNSTREEMEERLAKLLGRWNETYMEKLKESKGGKDARQRAKAAHDTAEGELKKKEKSAEDKADHLKELEEAEDYMKMMKKDAVSINPDAKGLFLQFATDDCTPWKANYRDMEKIISRMAVAAASTGEGKITEDIVSEQIARLREEWKKTDADDSRDTDKPVSSDNIQLHPFYSDLVKIINEKNKRIEDGNKHEQSGRGKQKKYANSRKIKRIEEYLEYEIAHLLHIFPILRECNAADAARKIFKVLESNLTDQMNSHLNLFYLQHNDFMN